jgi:hypothetical protein
VVIGAFRDDTGTNDAGSAYVYDLVGATPAVPIATLTNPVPAVNGYFGYSVAISGTLVIVGTSGGVVDTRAVYVYDLASAIPNIPAITLRKPGSSAGDRFGFSVAVDGTTVVAGTPYDDTIAGDRGAAYILGLRPALTILPAASGLATLSWTPTTTSGFALQYADSLPPTNWLNAPSGEANPVTVSSTNAARLYRLFQP